MATTITVRNLDERTQRLLRHRAVDHGRSLEAEIRAILSQAVSTTSPTAEPDLIAAARLFRLDLQETKLDFQVPDRIHEQPREVFS